MNAVYFACTECKNYVDAGYRWAYWQLEDPKIVRKEAVVEVDRVLAAEGYWKPEPDEHSAWLTPVLSRVEQFLLGHKAHRIIYGDMEQITEDQYERFAWMNEYPGGDTDLEPRNFIEQLGMRTWGEVSAYLSSRPRKPWWYEASSVRVAARRKFDELVLSEPRRDDSARHL